jgi:hypothetical protein
MKPKPTPSIIAETRHSPDRIVGTITARSNKPRAKRRTKVSNPYRDSDFDDFFKAQGIYEEIMASPKLKKAIRDLGDSIQAGMHEAFAAGWNAFLATHSGLLIAHGIKDFRVGFEEAWAKYWQSRKDNGVHRQPLL